MGLEVLVYNQVPLQIIATKEISRRHVMSDDNTTYEHTLWIFDVVTQLNPATIGVLLNLVGGSPARIDPILRKLLDVPRKSLVFSQSLDGTTYNVVLNVPNNAANLTAPGLPAGQSNPNANDNQGATFLTDCANGPMVEDFDVIRDHSGHTWMVKIRVVTRVRECPYTQVAGQGSQQVVPTANPIISNRWSRTMRTDEDHLSYIQTDGEVIFDSAWLLALGNTDADNTPGIMRWHRVPDQYRLDLFQPIPPNCKRDNIEVTQQSDGITYTYSFRDSEAFFNCLPATRFEATHTEGFSQQTQESAIAQGVVERLADARATIAAFGVGGFLSARFQTVIRSIPKFFSHISVRTYGNRDTPKWTLIAQAYAIAIGYIPNTRSVEFIITSELSGKNIELQLTSRSGPEEALGSLAFAVTDSINAIGGFLQSAVNGNVNLTRLFGVGGIPPISAGQITTLDKMMNNPEDDPEGFFGQDENAVRQKFLGRLNNAAWAAAFPDGANQYHGNLQPPNSNNTRGTMAVNLIAQALHNPCQPPPCPPPITIADDIATCPPGSETPPPGPTPSPEDIGDDGTGTLGITLGNAIQSGTNLPPLLDAISP